MRDWDRWIELIRRGELPQDFHCETQRPFFHIALDHGRQNKAKWSKADADSILPEAYLAIKARGPTFSPKTSDTRGEFWHWLRGVVEEVVRKSVEGDE